LFRRNIVAFGKGSGETLKAFKDLNADAWITWPDWVATHPDILEEVPLPPERQIWRDVNVTLSSNADPEAKLFLDFLVTKEAQALMKTEGWIR
jgi:accessory colonization factor AcfC